MDHPSKRRRLDSAASYDSRDHGDDNYQVGGSSSASAFSLESDVSELTLLDLKRIVLALERKLTKNIQERLKYPDQPEKFMDSEIELDEEVKKLQVLAASPELYPEFVKLNAIPSLLSLLAHENPDIVCDVIDALSELTEPDTVGETEEAIVLIDAFLENEILERVVNTMMNKLDESVEDEAKALHSCLKIVENLAEIKPEICEYAVQKTPILTWLLNRVNEAEYHPNKLYASEILAILLQTSDDVKKHLAESENMEQLLKSIAIYRKEKKPESIEEEEAIANLFGCICYALMLPELQTVFRRNEGIELMLIMIKKNKYMRYNGLKTLNYALMNSQRSCERFVDQDGIKVLFAAFMKRSSSSKGKKKDAPKEEEKEIEEHIISTMMSLFKQLVPLLPNSNDPAQTASSSASTSTSSSETPADATNTEESATNNGDSKPTAPETKASNTTIDEAKQSLITQRLLNKFRENDYQKTDRLMEFFFEYKKKVSDFEQKVASGELERILDRELDDEEIYIEMLDAGLFVLQQVCQLIGYISKEVDIRQRVVTHLEQRGLNTYAVAEVIKRYMDNTEADEEKIRARKLMDVMQS